MIKTKLTNLISGLQSAVVQALQQIEMQHTRMLEKYFEIDPLKKHITPKTVFVDIPARNKATSARETLEIPLITLIPIRSLKIEEISMSFDAKITDIDLEKINNQEHRPDVGKGYEEIVKNISPEIYIETKSKSFFSSATPISVSIKFKDNDPPEGVQRVLDHILGDIK